MITSSFRGFQIVTVQKDGLYVSIKKGNKYEIVLNVYKTAQLAKEGHEQLVAYYLRTLKESPNSTIGDVVRFKASR
jgi:hypothetical protein